MLASIASASFPTDHQLPGGTSRSPSIDSKARTVRALRWPLPPKPKTAQNRMRTSGSRRTEMKLGWVEHNDPQGFFQWKPLAVKLGHFCAEDPVIAAHSPQLLPYATLVS